jgi:micrococcal nuclease
MNRVLAWFIIVFIVAFFAGFLLRPYVPARIELPSTAVDLKKLLPTLGAPTTTPSTSGKFYTVTRVIDGDTVIINTGEHVRYVGVNSPELHHPTKGVECYGQEAADDNKRLVEGKKVRLVKDRLDKDQYGRLLRFVYLKPTTGSSSAEIFVNDYLVAHGDAFATTYKPDIGFKDEFKKSENEARAAQLGLWKTCM